MERFLTEECCKNEWRKIKQRRGVVHYWKSDKECFECPGCHYRQSIKANTVMHGSQLPIRYWFIAMHLLTSTKNGVSMIEFSIGC